MSALIEDMLSLSRMERRTETYPMEDMDLSGTLEDLCRDMELVMEKDISLIPEISPGIRVRGNEELLRRMASNLIGNALRYGKEKGHIWVRLYRKEEGTFLEVEDDGPGIPYPEQKKVFERFYRGDAARSGKGSGLGLSIVRQTALTHGGKVTLESRPGKGALFRVVLPGGE
ncbi:MAG: HAMP domain-containing histidine kinase [Lachnospiraceae bacterium]|nr:HAMP domain-containing histidine kinase [Lachnospiraceae bacterium]